MKRFFMLIAALFMALCIMFSTTPVFAAWKPPLVKEQDATYLVSFKNLERGYSKATASGKVKFNFKHFPVMAIKMTPLKAKLLALDPNIKFIEPDGAVKISEAYPWNITRINADRVQKKDITGQGIRVAIFDTGVDSTHEDLHIAGGISVLDGSANYADDNGHGTQVAGIIDAQYNEKGIIGASPGAELYSIKVLDKNGQGTYSQIISALDWALENNIKVVNMSFGGTQSSQALEQAMQAASDAGILLIAAAGNSEEIQYPAKYPSVMAIGAVDRNNQKASFSATGSDLELAAPGVGVSCTLPGNQYGTMTGTSAAAPHVAAAAALVWSQNPGSSNSEIRDLLKKSARPLGDPTAYGSGLVDVAKALNDQPPDETVEYPDYYFINKINCDLGKNLDTGRLTTINFLHSDREKVRLHAAKVLSEYAKYEDLPALYQTREKDPSQAVKQTAALSIAKTEWRTQSSDEGKLDLLAIQLKSNYPSVRDFAAYQLSQLNSEGSKALAAEALQDETDPARQSVLEATSQGTDSSAAVSSLAYAEDVRETVQIAAEDLWQSSYSIAPGDSISTSCRVTNYHSQITIRVCPWDSSQAIYTEYRNYVSANSYVNFTWDCPSYQEPGNYQIWYEYNDNSSSDYDTYFFFDVEESSPPAESDYYEPNDSMGQATSISVGDSISAYIENNGSDNDYYQLYCYGSGTLRFSMSGPSGNDYDVQLLNSSGSTIASSSNGGCNESFTANVSNGYYYIRVYSYGGCSSDYSYDFYTSFEEADPDPYEPNNSIYEATAISLSQSYAAYIGYANDYDYYRFTPGFSGQLAVSMSPPYNQDYDIELLDANGNTITGSYQAAGNTENFTCNVNGGVYYYLRIFGYSGQYGSQPYQFSTSLTVVKASLSLTVSSVAQVESGKTFAVNTTIANSASTAATNSSATISLPSGLSLAAGETAAKSLGSIGANSSQSVAWNVVAGNFQSDTTLTFTVSAAASNADTVQVNKNITVSAKPISGTPAMETIKSSPASQPERTGNFGKDHVVCPVDTSTGAYVLNKKVLALNGAWPFDFEVYYNSLLTKEGVMGKGWAHNLEVFLEALPDGSVNVHWDKNRQNTFANSNGQYISQDTVTHYDSLVKQADGSYTLTRQDQSMYLFNPSGQLVQLKNGHGQSLNLNYNGSGQLSSLTDPIANKALTFSYMPELLLASITDAQGRSVRFTYDGSHNLTGLSDAASNNTTYAYDSQSRLLSFVNASGVQVVTNTYDSLGRVASQDDAVSGNGTTSFAYDETSQPGQLITGVTDRNGKLRVFTHDNQYRLLSIKNELGHMESYSYDAMSNLTGETNAAAHTSSYSYDSRGNLTGITDPASRTTSMTYDSQNNLLSVKNAENKTVNFSYDGNNNPVNMTDPLGNTTTYSYDSNGLLASKSVPGAGTTSYSYQNGMLQSVTDPEGISSSFSYDSVGRITGVTNGAGKKITYTYDNNDHLLSVTDPLGNRTSYTVNEYGDALTQTDPRGNTTRFEYDSNGSLTATIDALSNRTGYQYDGEQRLTRIVDARGNATTLNRDAKGRVITTSNPLGKTTTYEYNPVDSLTGQTDPMGRKILSITYDALENPVTTTDALNQTTTYQYDQLNRLTAVIDPLQHQTRYGYDALNRMTASYDAQSGQAGQSFDEAGNLIALNDPNGNSTGFSYDRAGRVITETSACGSSKNYAYNAQNLLSEMKNGRGQTAQLSYDAAGRLTSLNDPAGSINYTYDASGNVLTITDSSGTITREYDALNRVTRYTDARGNRITYTYDAVGNLSAITYPDGKTVRYAYDAADRLTSVTDWAGRVTSYGYDDNDNLISTSRPDGSIESRTYDAAGRTTSINDTDNAGQVISRYDYGYDAADHISSEQAAVTLPFGMKNASMSYTSGNRLASYNGQAIEYDADGNMTTGPLAGKTSSYTYDARNRLLTAGNMSYQYDAENNRIAATVTDQVYASQTSYIINPNALLSQVLAASDSSGQTTYVYGLGLIGQQNPDGTYQTYHYDLRGSTVAITDQSGLVTDRYQYAPYG